MRPASLSSSPGCSEPLSTVTQMNKHVQRAFLQGSCVGQAETTRPYASSKQAAEGWDNPRNLFTLLLWEKGHSVMTLLRSRMAPPARS